MTHNILLGLEALGYVVGALVIVLGVGIGICLYEENTERPCRCPSCKWPSS